MTSVRSRAGQPTADELADRLQRRHIGAVVGTLDLATDRAEIVGRGRVRLPDGTEPGPDTLFEIGSITKNGGTGGFRSFTGFHPDHGQASVVLVNDV